MKTNTTLLPTGTKVTRIPKGMSAKQYKRNVVERKTRESSKEIFDAQVLKGCPHCGGVLKVVIKGDRSVFAACNSMDCPFITENRYYYISSSCETIDGMPLDEYFI